MNPDIVVHLIDPSGRRQEGSTWKSRSKGGNRDFLALGRWRRGGTACTSGSAVRLGGHLFVRKAKLSGGLCRWPPNTFWCKMDNDGRRIDAEFNSNSTRHHSNTLHCRAQGQWQRPHNPPQHLLSFLSFLHDCFIPKLPLGKIIGGHR